MDNIVVTIYTDLAINSSANYVIRKLVILSEFKAQKPLLDFLRNCPQELRIIKSSQYGRNII